MNIPKILLTLFLLFGLFLVNAQERLLNGQIVEMNTRKPIPYAMLIIKNTIYGTQADDNGFYELRLPAGYERDSIAVSSLSYEEKILSVKDMTQNQRIELAMNSNMLDEVVVYPIKAEDILREATKNRDKNHKSEKSIVQQVFVRELFFDKGECLRVGESIVDIYNLKLPNDSTISNAKKLVKARAVRDSTKLWFLNDFFRLKHDTISLDEPFFVGVTTFDITSILGGNSNKDKGLSEKEKRKKERKSKQISMDFNSDLKYNGTVKLRGRTTHRILVELTHQKKTIIKGHLLIDSATYAFSKVQLANQNVDLYKEFVPWYARGILRLLGYKPVVNRLSISSSYVMGDDEKWYKSYEYMRFGGSMEKRGRLLDGYAEIEYFYAKPMPYKGKLDSFTTKNEDFKENVVTSFDDDFWQPRTGQPMPNKVNEYIRNINKNNAHFEGSIGFNKKESRKKRRAERRKNRE